LFNIPFTNRLFVSWVGLRGAVPIVFAIIPIVAGIEHADKIFNIVFIVTVISIMLQGTTIKKMARWMGVEDLDYRPHKKATAFEFSEMIKTETAEVALSANSPAIGKKVFELDFPDNALLVMIVRNREHFVPKGSTELE